MADRQDPRVEAERHTAGPPKYSTDPAAPPPYRRANSKDIESDIRHTRSEMDETLDVLARRLRPSNLVREFIGGRSSRSAAAASDSGSRSGGWGDATSTAASTAASATGSAVSTIGTMLMHTLTDYLTGSSSKEPSGRHGHSSGYRHNYEDGGRSTTGWLASTLGSVAATGASATGRGAWSLIKKHPIPSLVIGAGVAYLLYEAEESTRQQWTGDDYDDEMYSGSYVDARTGRPYSEEDYGEGYSEGGEHREDERPTASTTTSTGAAAGASSLGTTRPSTTTGGSYASARPTRTYATGPVGTGYGPRYRPVGGVRVSRSRYEESDSGDSGVWGLIKRFPIPTGLIAAALAYGLYEAEEKARSAWSGDEYDDEMYSGSYVDARTGRAYGEEDSGAAYRGGAAYAGHKAYSGASYAGGALINGVYYTARQIRDGASAALESVKEGADYAGEILLDGAHYTADQLSRGAEEVASSTSHAARSARLRTRMAGRNAYRSASSAGHRAYEGAAYAGHKAYDGASYAGGALVDGVYYTADQVRAGAATAASSVKDGTEYAGEVVLDGIRYSADQLSEGASYVAHEAAKGYRYAKDELGEAYEQYPLALGAAAFAGGLLLGLLLPPTKVEDEWVGHQSEELWDEGKHYASDAAERARRAAYDTAGAVGEEARRQGLTPSDLVERVTDAAGKAVSRASDAAVGAFKEEGLTPDELKSEAASVAQVAKDKVKGEAREAADDTKAAAGTSGSGSTGGGTAGQGRSNPSGPGAGPSKPSLGAIADAGNAGSGGSKTIAPGTQNRGS